MKLDKLPSFLGFQPKFYQGGAQRLNLPLLYDLVVSGKPTSIVTLGFGDGEACFTICQAARENNIDCTCVAVRRQHADEKNTDDRAWLEGKGFGEEFYGDLIRFSDGSPAEVAKEFSAGSVDLLLLADCDAGAAIHSDLSVWESKLSPNGLVLVQGISLERADSPKAVWLKWSDAKPTAEFPEGVGVGITSLSKTGQVPEFVKQFLKDEDLREELIVAYRLAATRIEAQAHLDHAKRVQAALETRQVWLDSLLADRWKAQEIMDHQARANAELAQAAEEQRKKFELLRRDRAKAQLVIDAQVEEIERWTVAAQQLETEVKKLKARLTQQKEILAAVRKKKKRPMWERIVREIRRAPRNLFGRREAPKIDRASTPKAINQTAETPIPEIPPTSDRYWVWIAKHEPDAAALERQWVVSELWTTRPKISLLVPVHNTMPHFLEEMLKSVASQSYQNWELCLVDAGSINADTDRVLKTWTKRDTRIRLKRLTANFGIAENTNRAMRLASGDFIACLDHDDLLAPFALYELAAAILATPDADIFYSDEDRWTEKHGRHAPFFKPDWSPELLYSCMYLGHLTAYRHALVEEVGGWRKEFDLSQDYDFALRATERARKIEHVPHVLYHWREHPQSGSLGGKPEARKTNLAALAEAIRRRGFSADILEYSTANRVRLKIAEWPKVSIIIPTDSAERGQRCVTHLPNVISYPDYEVVIVTNAALAKTLRRSNPNAMGIRYLSYDKPFNFSEKCNLGAQAATGRRLVFVNDDVESVQPDWIQNLIEPLENPEIGAVAPKLLYATGKIQHAGLVTGVRGLIGTAFHELAADTTVHVNFAQSMRDVSALSGACLAIRRDIFFQVGGFDAENAPVSHSDIDLCFKLRAAGLRCIYTPFAKLTHVGHVSIGGERKTASAERARDKSSMYLLRRWGGYVTRDPYYTTNMRDWLYGDSPTPIRMFARDDPMPSGTSHDLLFISHDLSLSGAPILLLHLAIWCKRNGFFVVVMAPNDGPLRERYQAADIPLIVDPLILTEHESFAKFARDFDCVVANTTRSAPAVRSAHSVRVPVIWWVHETLAGEHYLREDAKLRSALPLADMVLAPSEATASVFRPYATFPIECRLYGIPDVATTQEFPGSEESRPMRFLLLGSIEPRKGQDVFMHALELLPVEMRGRVEFHLLGRVLDPDFAARVETAAARMKNVFINGPRDHAEALDALRRSDVLVCSSRDEAMPVTILEALSLGRAIISTKVGGIKEILTDGYDALLVRPEDPVALAGAMRRLVENSELGRRLGQNARATFEKTFTLDRFGAEFRDLVSVVIARCPGPEHRANN